MSCVDFLIVEERIIMDSDLVSNTNILVSILDHSVSFGKHLGPFGKLRFFVAEGK